MTERNMRVRGRSALVPVAATLLLLGGFVADQSMQRVPTAEAAEYHARVQEAAARVPFSIGPWLGTDVAVPQAAVQLLKPNVIVSRRYEELRSGRRVDFLLVQCSDARDLLGHYPPVCYPSAGWTRDWAEPRDWRVDGVEIPGMVYRFSTNRHGLPQRMTIYNFIVLPDGQICRAMDEADEAAQDLRRKFLGAAQVQFVFNAATPLEENDAVLETIVRANHDLFETIRRGFKHEED